LTAADLVAVFLAAAFFAGAFFGCSACWCCSASYFFSSGCGFARRFSRGLARRELAGGKLKVDLARLGVPRQHGFKAPAGTHGDKLVQQIGLAGGQQLHHLLTLNGLLQNNLPALEVAVGGGLL